MPEEMILRYLYYLTNMYAGTYESEWSKVYQAWAKFGRDTGDDYGKYLKLLTAFDKKYRLKKNS